MALPPLLIDGRYRITRQLGEGGMGLVYEGIHLALDRKVAIKVLHARLAHDERFRERFLREARSASRIHHPNVVQILDFGQTSDGSAYFVMEFLEGKDLRLLLNEVKKLPWARARWILLQAVHALRAAHGKNIIHRDIKPGNCLLFDSPDEGTVDNVKLLDFGIAKIVADANEGDPHGNSLTGTGEVFGTASYMAPEQAHGKSLDARSDIYSLGIMAYEMLTGMVPFTGANPIHVITRHLTDPPRPLREIDPSIPPAVEALVLRALEKKPELRFGSMAEVAEALQAIPVDAGASPEGVGPTLGMGVLQPETREPPRPSDSTELTGQRLNRGEAAAPLTEMIDAGSLSIAHDSASMGVDDSGSASQPAGTPGFTVVVPSRPLLIDANASISSSHPQWASQPAGANPGTRPPPGEVDVATSRLHWVEPAPASMGPLHLEPVPMHLADTHSHSISTIQRREAPRRTALILGVLALLGGGGGLAAVAWSNDESEATVVPKASETQPASSVIAKVERPLVLSEEPASSEAALAPASVTEPTAIGSGAAGRAIAEDARLVDEPVDSSVGAAKPKSEIGAAPPLVAVPDTPKTLPAKKSHAPAPPRKQTDAQVKSKLVQAIQRECGNVGQGSHLDVEVTVGSDGTILLKTIAAAEPLKSCVAKQLAKVAFPAGTTRKLEIPVQL